MRNLTNGTHPGSARTAVAVSGRLVICATLQGAEQINCHVESSDMLDVAQRGDTNIAERITLWLGKN